MIIANLGQQISQAHMTENLVTPPQGPVGSTVYPLHQLH